MRRTAVADAVEVDFIEETLEDLVAEEVALGGLGAAVVDVKIVVVDLEDDDEEAAALDETGRVVEDRIDVDDDLATVEAGAVVAGVEVAATTALEEATEDEVVGPGLLGAGQVPAGVPLQVPKPKEKNYQSVSLMCRRFRDLPV